MSCSAPPLLRSGLLTASRTPDLRVSPLTVPYLGMLASLQLIDPSGANIALVKASDALQMHGPTLALGAGVSTLAQAASVVVMGYSAIASAVGGCWRPLCSWP